MGPEKASALVCLASGAALALCLPRPGLTFLAWFLPALLLDRLLRAPSAKRGAFLGWLFGAAFCGTALHWIYLTCRYAGVFVPLAFSAWALLAAFLGLNWALFGLLARPLGALSPWMRPWAWAVLLAGVESLSARFGGPRLGPDVLAYTQWRHPILLQGLAWGGPHALSFLILLVNGVLLGLWRRDRGAVPNAAAAALLLGLWTAHGASVLAGRSEAFGSAGAPIEILQANIDQYEKWDERYEEKIRGAFDALLSRPRSVKPSLVLWPESALPGWLDDPKNSRWVSGWARRLGAAMLVGSVARLGERTHNSAVLFDERGEPSGLYNKRRLVPFGEFVPWREKLEPFIGILSQMGDFHPGQERQPFISTPAGPLAVTICYEQVFPRLVLGDAARGARMFANLTNDGWYKDTWGPYQHFWVNVFRAAETRSTLLRAANTGISGVIDPYGIVLAKTGLMRAERLDARLPLVDPFPGGSFYARRGDWAGALCLLCAALFLLAAKDNRRKIS
ncbi:MAG TPA: apolipoprotein N-acyltransferase [Elusimicrobia bacterium]|nr:apolipoprotein N-acyltransferase [Elusimicrobiota bacterium]